MSNNIKTFEELSVIVRGPLYFNIIKYGLENVKEMKDQYGLTFLHYYFLVHDKLDVYIYKDDAQIYDEINFFIDEKFDFTQQTTQSYVISDNQKTGLAYHKTYSVGNMTAFHAMSLFLESTKKLNIEMFSNLLLHFDNHIEDSLGLTALMYALEYDWFSYINLAIKDNRKILSPHLEKNKDYVIKLIKQKKNYLSNKNELIKCQSLENLLIKIEKDSLELALNDNKINMNNIIKI